MNKRVKRLLDNFINVLILFGNILLYIKIIFVIYRIYLD